MANEEVDRRAEILNAAVELFGTLGYYGTSLQKIADRVGLTKAGVLHYVGSKEGLLTAALDEVYDSETEDILTDMVREPQNRGGERTQTDSGAHVFHVERRSDRPEPPRTRVLRQP